MKKSIFRAPAAYLMVVLCGYAIDFSVYSALVYWGWGVAAANTVAFGVGSVVNALLVRRFVFDNHRFSASADLVLTLVVNVAIFAAGTWVLSYMVNGLGLNPYVSKILTNGLTFASNFTIRALFFRKP